MKPAAVFGAFLAAANAFPTPENLAKLGLQTRDTEVLLREIGNGIKRANEKRLLIDPMTTPVDVSGEHEFQPPNLAAGDQRGPCPGLNALANHGYIPRDGVVGFADLIVAANSVFGMGLDLITILAVMGTVGVGNPLSLNPGFSIGGPTPKSSNILGGLGGLVGEPRGLQGAHNWIESDGSGTRDDLYTTGNAWTMNMSLFLKTYDSIPDGGYLSIEDIGDMAARRLHEGIATNPYFYYGPYTGMVARNAGYLFMGRILSNHSLEHPEGRLTKEVFASLFGVTVENGKPTYHEGHERIPANWYRTPVDYGLVSLNVDLVAWILQHPELASIGGNMGEVNTFTGLDFGGMTGGLLNLEMLLEGNNLLCFALQFVKTFAPNSLSGLFRLLEVPLQILGDALADPLLDLGCPAWHDLTVDGEDFLTGAKKRYPGAAKGFAL